MATGNQGTTGDRCTDRRFARARSGAWLVLAGMALVGCSSGSTSYPEAGDPSGSTSSGPVIGGSGDGSGGSSGGDSAGEGGPPVTPGGAGSETGTGGATDPLSLLGDDALLLSRIPEVIETITLADTGLRVAYTQEGQRDTIDPAYLESQWTYMQDCTGVTGVPPLMVVVAGLVQPFVATDDVIRDITGAGQASTSVTSAGAVVQISDADFDGSLGVLGFLTRASLGRMLWIGDGLADRDYPFECARNDPTDPLNQASTAR